MQEFKMGIVERRFAEIIWASEPISSGELVKKCAEELEWKKSTTYTVLKKLCERGIFQNVDGTVTSLVGRAEFDALQSEQFVEETFSGSLPAFIAAFTTRKAPSAKELEEIQRMIAAFAEENHD